MRKHTVLLLLILSLILIACGGEAPEEPTQEPAPPPTEEVEDPQEDPSQDEPAESSTDTSGEGGQLVTFASSDPGTLDPAALATYDQTLIVPNIVEGLLRLSADGQSIDPGIAEDYSVNDDGTIWTFNLRSGATFHNGDPITANDFKFSFERVLAPDMASPKAWLLEGVAGASEFQSGDADEVSGIEVVDDQTLRITLSEPLGFFPALVANPALAVVSPTAVEEFGEDFGQNVVSAGPFKLSSWNINQDLTIEAFDDYWNSRPQLDTVLFRIIGDENTRIIEFDAGNLDITWVPPAHWDRFSTSPIFEDELGWAETFHTEFIAVNMESEPFGSNPALRQAVCHALDREAAIASLQGRASSGQGILPPGLLGFDPDAEICSYDPDRARELLAEAGFEGGLDETFNLLMPPWNNLLTTMQIYQANLAEIGINLELQPTEFGPYIEALDNGSYDLAWIYRVADYADPDSFYYPMLHSNNIGGGGNIARYASEEIDQLVIDGRAAVVDSDREEAYASVDALFATELPYIPLLHNIYVDVRQPWVENYTPSPMDTHLYHEVWLSDDQE